MLVPAAAMAAPIPIVGSPAARLYVSGEGGGDDPEPPTGLYQLPAERVTLWQPGVTHNGGIPNRSTVYTTLTPSGSNDRTAIQNAINACPSGQVVQLGEGEFNISGSPIMMTKNGITLRGAGPDKTIIRGPGNFDQSIIVIGRRWINTEASTDLTTDATKGSYSVTVSSTSGFSVGQLVLIDQTTVAGVSYWSSDCNTSCQGWFSRTGRPLGQMMEIASIVGNTITFTTPFHITFSTANSAQMTRFESGYPAIEWAGIEDLKVYGGGGGDGGGNIRFELAKYCWAKNVESEYSAGASVRLFRSFRCEVRDSYFHTTRNPNPGGDGYGIDIGEASADCLVENNISWNFNKTILARACGGGNVVAYNYFQDGYGAGYPTIPEVGLNLSHMATPHFCLFEGNEAWNAGGESRWGNSIYMTFFRNSITGLRVNKVGGLSDTNGRRIVEVTARHYWYNWVGNVLGYAGMSPTGSYTGFEYEDTYPYGGSLIPVWVFGRPDPVGTSDISTTDTNVAATALRDGNFDFATNQVRWHGIGGAPTTTPPENSTLPASLYLSEKPAFFGELPWPWVTPEGSVKTHTLPAKQRFEAMFT